jgi:hypothetical protein
MSFEQIEYEVSDGTATITKHYACELAMVGAMRPSPERQRLTQCVSEILPHRIWQPRKWRIAASFLAFPWMAR